MRRQRRAKLESNLWNRPRHMGLHGRARDKTDIMARKMLEKMEHERLRRLQKVSTTINTRLHPAAMRRLNRKQTRRSKMKRWNDGVSTTSSSSSSSTISSFGEYGEQKVNRRGRSGSLSRTTKKISQNLRAFKSLDCGKRYRYRRKRSSGQQRSKVGNARAAVESTSSLNRRGRTQKTSTLQMNSTVSTKIEMPSPSGYRGSAPRKLKIQTKDADEVEDCTVDELPSPTLDQLRAEHSSAMYLLREIKGITTNDVSKTAMKYEKVSPVVGSTSVHRLSCDEIDVVETSVDEELEDLQESYRSFEAKDDIEVSPLVATGGSVRSRDVIVSARASTAQSTYSSSCTKDLDDTIDSFEETLKIEDARDLRKWKCINGTPESRACGVESPASRCMTSDTIREEVVGVDVDEIETDRTTATLACSVECDAGRFEDSPGSPIRRDADWKPIPIVRMYPGGENAANAVVRDDDDASLDSCDEFDYSYDGDAFEDEED